MPIFLNKFLKFLFGIFGITVCIAASKHNTTRNYDNKYEKKGRTTSTHIPKKWIKYIDESQDEFWQEGNHLPDQGFVILLKEPTLTNAKLWLLRMEKKANRAEEVMALVLKAQEELVREGKIKDRYGMVMSNNPEYAPIKKLYQDQFKSLSYFFIFKPGCHACIKTAENLEGFPNVMPLQATQGELFQWDNLPNTRKASRETLNDYAKDGSVPVIVIADPIKNRVSKLKGLQTKQQIMEASVNLLKLRFSEKQNDKS